MRGALEVALKASLHPRHQHCTVEAKKAEMVLFAGRYGSLVNNYIFHFFIHTIYMYIVVAVFSR